MFHIVDELINLKLFLKQKQFSHIISKYEMSARKKGTRGRSAPEKGNRMTACGFVFCVRFRGSCGRFPVYPRSGSGPFPLPLPCARFIGPGVEKPHGNGGFP